MDQKMIAMAIERHNGNLTAAAEQPGIDTIFCMSFHN